MSTTVTGVAAVDGNAADPSTGNANSNLPYKTYIASLSFIDGDGQEALSAFPLVNTLGGIPAFTKQSTGSYLLTLNGAFPIQYTIFNPFGAWNGSAQVFLPLHDGSEVVGYYSIYAYGSPDHIKIQVLNASGANTDWANISGSSTLMVDFKVFQP